MEASLDDWLQPFEDSMVMNHDSWLITDHQEEEGATTRGKNGGGMGAAFLLNAFGADVKFEDKFDVEDEEIATGNQGDLERFFKHGSTGLDTLLTNAAVVKDEQEELPDVNAFSFRWDDDEELKLNGGSDTEDHPPSLLLDSEDQLLLNSGLLSFDDITLHSTSSSLSSMSPSSSLSTFATGLSLSSPTLPDAKGSSNPSSPTPSSSPLPSSPPSSVAPAPAPATLQQQPTTCSVPSGGAMPPYAGSFHPGASPSATLCAPPPPSTAVQSAPMSTSSSSSRVRRPRVSSSKVTPAAKKAASSSTPPRPRRRRAASTTVARDKQDRMAQEMAGDDLAKAILSGPLTLEKLASLSTLKVSVLQKQLKLVNASTKGAKAQLIQRLVRYMYLFSQQHRHQVHTSSCGLSHHQPTTTTAATASRCSGPFVDPTLINADSVRAKAAAERGRSISVGDGSPVPLSSSAPSLSVASYLSTHLFPTPLQITLTGRIVEEEEEEEFSD